MCKCSSRNILLDTLNMREGLHILDIKINIYHISCLKVPSILIQPEWFSLSWVQLVEIVPSALVLFILRKLPPRRVSDQYHPIKWVVHFKSSLKPAISPFFVLSIDLSWCITVLYIHNFICSTNAVYSLKYIYFLSLFWRKMIFVFLKLKSSILNSKCPPNFAPLPTTLNFILKKNRSPFNIIFSNIS